MEPDLKALLATLNPTCRQALEEAAALAATQGHRRIEVEHVLRALVERSGTDLDAVLRHHDLRRRRLAEALDLALRRLEAGHTRVPTFSPEVPTLLREAWLVSSLTLGSTRVRSAAVLLAARTVEGLRDRLVAAVPALRRFDPDVLRVELPALIRGSAEAASSMMPAGAHPPAPGLADGAGETPALDQYPIDLGSRAREGALDPGVGRDAEVRRVIDVLTRRRQNNPILVGPAGVGKTAIVEGLALRVARGDVPPALRAVSVRLLDLALLQAGAGLAGEFERRLKAVVADVQGAVRPVVLFIDEAHTLIGAGGAAGQRDAANLLKPALARGELRTIAATTWSEYKRSIEQDPALARRFQLVPVDEPDADTAVEMLRASVEALERHHGVRVLDAAAEAAVQLSQRYVAGRLLPDKAVSVLDTCCARVALGQRSTPPAVEAAGRRVDQLTALRARLRVEDGAVADHAARIAALDAELDAAARDFAALESRWRAEQGEVRRIAELAEARADAPDDAAAAAALRAARTALRGRQGAQPMVPLEVDVRLVAEVVSGWTGVPVGRMLTDDADVVLGLAERLAARVVGQSAGLDAIARRLQTAQAGLDDPGRPLGVFLLVGPSGVGKTETALALADALFGGEDKAIVVNLSEFQEAHSVSTLKGAPPGYMGYGRGGVLTEAVRRRPYSVVLLDEVDKAHPDVRQLFFQVFDKGVLEDGEGVRVDFRNTVVLLTSNVGAEAVVATAAQGGGPGAAAAAARPALEAAFGAAFLGRVVVVPYGPLARAELRAVAGLKLAAVQARFEGRHQAPLRFAAGVVELLATRCADPHVGARGLDAILTHALLPGLSAAVLTRVAEGRAVCGVEVVDDGEGGFAFHWADDPPPARRPATVSPPPERTPPPIPPPAEPAPAAYPPSGVVKRAIDAIVATFGAGSRHE